MTAGTIPSTTPVEGVPAWVRRAQVVPTVPLLSHTCPISGPCPKLIDRARGSLAVETRDALSTQSPPEPEVNRWIDRAPT
jgi:hypothetical protein